LIENEIDFQIVSKEGVLNLNYKNKTLFEALEKEISPVNRELVPKSYDIIGHIAIIELDKINLSINEDLKFLKKKIAKALINVNKKIKTVYEKKSEIKGSYRLRELELLYGEDDSETIYRENNCIFKLDVKRMYFTPRLVYERRRIASSPINEYETIVDMFAGVGPFSIQIAKQHQVLIYAFDLNPHAFKYLKENIKLNNIKGKIFPYNIDVKNICCDTDDLGNMLHNQVDRIIMNLPESSLNFIDVVCYLMKKSGGILHIYQFCEKSDPMKKAIENLRTKLNGSNWSIEKIFECKVVKTYSPKSDLVVIDAAIKQSKT
jgi:tRNA (guanine37-N1)-methyltransferase